MNPLPWSISTLDKFVTCPTQYAAIKVYRTVKEAEGAAAAWGNRVHDAAEANLRDNKPLDPELASYQPYLDEIKRLPGTLLVEQKLALNTQFKPVAFDAKDVWVRGKCDALTIDGALARALDHKTGKRKSESRQMVLMALLIFHHHPEVMEVRTAFFWLKHAKRDTGVYRRADMPAMWNMFVTDLKQYRDAFATETWQPRQSGLCYGWCPVTTCEFWKPKKAGR